MYSARECYKGEVSMYKLNDIHNYDVGNKGNFEKMVISEADRVKLLSKNNFLENTFLVRAIHMKYSIYIVRRLA